MFDAEWFQGAAQIAVLFGLFAGAFVAAVEGLGGSPAPADPPAETKGGRR